MGGFGFLPSLYLSANRCFSRFGGLRKVCSFGCPKEQTGDLMTARGSRRGCEMERKVCGMQIPLHRRERTRTERRTKRIAKKNVPVSSTWELWFVIHCLLGIYWVASLLRLVAVISTSFCFLHLLLVVAVLLLVSLVAFWFKVPIIEIMLKSGVGRCIVEWMGNWIEEWMNEWQMKIKYQEV